MKMMLTPNILEDGMATTPAPLVQKMHHGHLSWFTWWYDDSGTRRDKWFGKVAATARRKANADRSLWLALFSAHARIRNPKANEHTYSVAELAQDYLAYAKTIYIKHGRPTTMVGEVATSMQILLDAFGGKPASDVTNPLLSNLRDAMIHRNDNAVRGMKTVNGRLAIIKQAYKWGREKGMISREALADILAVGRLRPGRSQAKDPVAVGPVADEWIAAVKAECPKVLAAMIELQVLTGMRPGEVRMMRKMDIAMKGDVWTYTPSEHKTEHHGKSRSIAIGQRSRTILGPFLERKPDAFLFSPREAQKEQRGGVSPLVGDHYTKDSYRRAIAYACDRAFDPTRERREAGDTSYRWHPHQLRHTFATKANQSFALEDVSIALGHSDLRTTRRYAKPDQKRANRLARKAG